MFENFKYFPANNNLTLPKNSQGRDFVVGDIHGEYELLIKQLSDVDFDNTQDRLISCGDFIDRGPDSSGCIGLLKQPWFFAVQGNHEHMFLNSFINERVKLLHKINGGVWTEQYNEEQLSEFANIIYQYCPLSFTLETKNNKPIGITHACAPLNWSELAEDISEQQKMEYLWSVEQFKAAKQNNVTQVSHIDMTIHGHVNCQQIEHHGNQVWLDTLHKTGKLTILNIERLMF